MRAEGAEVLQGELVTKVMEGLISPLIFPAFDLGRVDPEAAPQENYQDKTHLCLLDCDAV